ncbi:MAG: response regulator [Anaerolineales bacterium]
MRYHVQVAADVNAAIQYAARSAPDLVIADLNLPGLSGKDLLVALNSQGFRFR